MFDHYVMFKLARTTRKTHIDTFITRLKQLKQDVPVVGLCR